MIKLKTFIKIVIIIVLVCFFAFVILFFIGLKHLGIDGTRFYEGLGVYQEGGKYGYINKDGEFLIPAQFESADDFYNNRASVKYNGKWGIIDRTGKFIVKPSLDFPPSPFLDGYAIAGFQEEKVGFLNMQGEWAISPRYKKANFFSEGLAAVRESDKWGFINPKGDYVIQPEYEDAGIFKEGLAAVKKDGKWGFINKFNQWKIKPYYDDAQYLSCGHTAVKIGENWGVISSNGKLVSPFQYRDIMFYTTYYEALDEHGWHKKEYPKDEQNLIQKKE